MASGKELTAENELEGRCMALISGTFSYYELKQLLPVMREIRVEGSEK